MSKISARRLQRVAAVAIVVVALLLRLWGANFGLPYIIQPDEPSVVDRTLHMWLAHDANPHYFVYPSLYYDIEAVWEALVGHVAGLFRPSVLQHPLLHKEVYYLAGRGLSAAMGTATVGVVYLVGRELSIGVGLLSALALAVMPQHVQQSHYITVDGLTALFTALTAFYALRMLTELRPRQFKAAAVGAAICTGLAAGTKYNAAIALCMPLVACVLSRHQSIVTRALAIGGVVLIAIATFIVTTPYAIIDPQPFRASLGVVFTHYTGGHVGAEGANNAIWYISYLMSTGCGVVITVLGLLGLVVCVPLFRERGVILVAFSGLYYALLASTVVRFDRNLLPLLPFIALGVGGGIYALVQFAARRFQRLGTVWVAGVLIVALPAGYSSVYAGEQSDIALSHPFTEEVAAQWADRHLPHKATIATENWEGRPFEASPRQFKVSHFSSISDVPFSWFKIHNVDYVISDSYTEDAYRRESAKYRDRVARYTELESLGHVLVRITGKGIEMPGPTMTIYGVR